MKWALVLSGGGGKGIAHIGAIKAIERLGYKPDLVVGTSIGAIIGGIYASGMTIDEMEEFVLQRFNIKRYMEGLSYQLPDLPFVKFLQAGEAINHLLNNQAVDPGDKLQELIAELTEHKHFHETWTPFVCNAVDILSGRHILLQKGLLSEAIRASMSFPGVFAPKQRGEMLLIDGGVMDNMPVWVARKMGFHRVLAINVTPMELVEEQNLRTGIDVIMRAFSIISSNTSSHPYNSADLEIKASDGSSQLNFENKQRLVQLGYNSVMNSSKDINKLLKSRFGWKSQRRKALWPQV